MLQLTIIDNGERVAAWLLRVQSAILRNLYAEMEVQMIKLRDYVVEEKLSGEVLHNRTGTLRRAQHSKVSEDGRSILGNVFTDPSASKYGRVHEYGGTFSVREHLRSSRHGMGTWVRPHNITFPERSFLRSSLRENAPTIKNALQAAIDRALTETT